VHKVITGCIHQARVCGVAVDVLRDTVWELQMGFEVFSVSSMTFVEFLRMEVEEILEERLEKFIREDVDAAMQMRGCSLLYISCDLAKLGFVSCNSFKLSFLHQMLTDLPEIKTGGLPICDIDVHYIKFCIMDLVQFHVFGCT
jgi:hypothetical protein